MTWLLSRPPVQVVFRCAWSVAVLFPACLRLLPLVYLQGGHPGVSSSCLCSFLLHCLCVPCTCNYLACFATALGFAPQWFLYPSDQLLTWLLSRPPVQVVFRFALRLECGCAVPCLPSSAPSRQPPGRPPRGSEYLFLCILVAFCLCLCVPCTCNIV
jgi:hypothetical protein